MKHDLLSNFSAKSKQSHVFWIEKWKTKHTLILSTFSHVSLACSNSKVLIHMNRILTASMPSLRIRRLFRNPHTYTVPKKPFMYYLTTIVFNTYTERMKSMEYLIRKWITKSIIRKSVLMGAILTFIYLKTILQNRNVAISFLLFIMSFCNNFQLIKRTIV